MAYFAGKATVSRGAFKTGGWWREWAVRRNGGSAYKEVALRSSVDKANAGSWSSFAS
jgi:hypothetical protein